MTKHFMIFAIAVLLIAADTKNDVGPEDRSVLQGRWISMWSNVGGKSCKIDEGNILMFEGDHLTWTFKEDVDPEELRFKVDPKTGSVDLLSSDETDDKPSKGLYRIKGDTLILCIAQAGQPRPAEINTVNERDETLMLYVLVRDK